LEDLLLGAAHCGPHEISFHYVLGSLLLFWLAVSSNFLHHALVSCNVYVSFRVILTSLVASAISKGITTSALIWWNPLSLFL
jgi:hypothetical protein